MSYWQCYGTVLELISSGVWGESLGVEFLQSRDLPLPVVALPLSPSTGLSEASCREAANQRSGGRGRLSHPFTTSLINNFHLI